MKSSTVIGGTSDKHDRHESDFYPTPPECTVALINFLESIDALRQGELIWECASGDFAIGREFCNRGYIVAATDIREVDVGLSHIDFLNTDLRLSEKIATNPPFNLAEDFIVKCIGLNLIMFAMFLKGSYWHSKNRLPLFNLQKPSYVLPLTWRPVFVESRGKSPTMEFMWTVWFKGDETTKYVPLKKPITERHQPLF